MNIKRITYTNTDKEYSEAAEFLIQLFRKNPYAYWDSGRMNFWRTSVHGAKEQNNKFFSENVKLWKDGQKIVGLCISEYGRNDMFIEVEPGYEAIYEDIFDWVENEWAKDKEAIEIDVIFTDEKKIKVLNDAGYEFKAHTENRRFYDLNNINLDYNLKQGYKICAFYESADYESRVALVKSAFNNQTYSEKNIRSIQACDDYIKELDLCVVAPDGELAAYCIGWLDKAKENTGFIEPVGTHANHRRLGLASSIIKECFTRLKALGVTRVDISSLAEPALANFLYDSLNPKDKIKIYKYHKKKSV